MLMIIFLPKAVLHKEKYMCLKTVLLTQFFSIYDDLSKEHPLGSVNYDAPMTQ